MHAREEVLAVRGWPEPGVIENFGVTQSLHVRPILADPCEHLISPTDGPVTGDDDIDVARNALKQSQRGEVVLDRVSGAGQVEHRNQDIRKQVAGGENLAFLDQPPPVRGNLCPSRPVRERCT